MPIAVVQRIEAWSFSRWKDYEKCPFYAKLKHIDKKKEAGGAAMLRGGEIDKKAELYLKGQLDDLPAELASFSEEFAELKKLSPNCQEEWAFDANWRQVDWFSKQAWCRVKMDAAALVKKVLRCIDFKTGKPREDHKLQLGLYALAGLLIFPKATKVETNLWYTDLGKEDPKTFTRAQVPQLKAEWEERVQPMLTDTRFAPKPGNYCSWCPHSRSKGGPCEY